jgi:hypothetical protein
MDSYEQLVATLLNHHGFWVKQSYKVALTKKEKIKIGRPSAPRWELDLIAYKPEKNELWVVECKSLLDSHGVWINHFLKPAKKDGYKLFNEPLLRKTVFSRLRVQLKKEGLVQSNPTIKLCLAAGHIRENENREELVSFFKKRNWNLLDETWINKLLTNASETSYEDDIAFVVAKLLERNRKSIKSEGNAS